MFSRWISQTGARMISSIPAPSNISSKFAVAAGLTVGAGTFFASSMTTCEAQAPSPARCTASQFKDLLVNARWTDLHNLDLSHLATRLIVKTDEELQDMHARPTAHALNSKQVVFVTPAASWVKWGMTTASSSSKAVSGLEFVGWPNDGIDWAHKEGLSASIFVWEDPDLANGNKRTALWDFVFDVLLPECKASAATFRPLGGTSLQKAWWVVDDPEMNSMNAKFVRLSQTLRDKVAAVPFSATGMVDKSVGVREVLEASLEKNNDVALKVRQALKNMFYLDILFAGDGFTRNVQGDKLAQELIITTKRLSDLMDLETIDLGKV